MALAPAAVLTVIAVFTYNGHILWRLLLQYSRISKSLGMYARRPALQERRYFPKKKAADHKNLLDRIFPNRY
ncbi:MAG: hypothetical protein M0Z67_18910 [Nitrospiraceae bacterium]|nr:hypothetical protein [Nitrospiraceae bacterium]